MAKKTTTKKPAVAKRSAKSAKASAKKPAPKTPAAKKSAPAANSSAKPAAKSSSKPASNDATAGPRPIKSGPGASPQEIGASLVELFNQGDKDEQIWSKWWDKSVVSVEGMGLAWHGEKAVRAKNEGWTAQNEVLGASAEGPYVGATGFAVKFRMDVRERATGKRTIMEEVGVYTVRNGKIVQEEFMYGQATQADTVLADAARPRD